MLPSCEEIQKWDDNKLKDVHFLLFDLNTYPGINETREEVDNYLYTVHVEYENRFNNVSK